MKPGPTFGIYRRVIITFDPKTFHKSYQDLGKKVQKVRRELAALQQRYQEEAGEDAPQAIKDHLAQLCQRLKLDPDLFQLSFPRENGRFNLSLQLNHRQMASNVRHFGKNILITDREDWDTAEIYETFSRRGVLEAQRRGGKTNGQWSNNGQESQSPIYETLMPLYHWTGSKIRVHLFVCVVAMTYLALLWQQLDTKGVSITPREAMDELRSLKTAIFQESDDGKLKRMLDQVNDRQSTILKAMGYQVQEGKVLPL